MSPQVKERIFDPFYTTKFTGRGLGLSAVQGILRSHGGGVRVLTEAGRGTTFRLLFPALISAKPAPFLEPVGLGAYHGTGSYKDKGAVKNLRAIAMLYPESLHLVARRDAHIHSVRDLKGKRVSFGGKDSGELLHGRMLLAAFGLSESQVKLSILAPEPAADAIAAGTLDAMLTIDAYPIPIVTELAQRAAIDLIPITGPEVDKLRAKYPFLSASALPAGTYAGQTADVPTLDVGMMLVTGANQPDDLIYGITRALWHPSTQKLLTDNQPRGKLFHLSATELGRTGIQLHGGASAYYFDAGVTGTQ